MGQVNARAAVLTRNSTGIHSAQILPSGGHRIAIFSLQGVTDDTRTDTRTTTRERHE
jgi:hypothetical protein